MKEQAREIQFNKWIKELIDNESLCGASWAFVSLEEDRSLYEGVFGKINQYDKKELDNKSVYDIASLTKIIGATTRIFQLIESGRIKLSTKVSEVLTDYDNLNCTVEQLLTHTSGLAADFNNKENLNWNKVDEYLSSIQLTSNLNDVTYSDIGFIILGMMVEEIDNCSLELSFTQNIFKPLSMSETTYYPKNKSHCVPTELVKGNLLLVGRVHDSKGRNLDREIGSSGLFSTLDDLIKYTRTFMDNSSNSQLLIDECYYKMEKTDYSNRTLGWEWLKKDVLFHTGFTGTSIAIDLKEKNALILLTNRVHPDRSNIGFIDERKNAYLTYFKENLNDK